MGMGNPEKPGLFERTPIPARACIAGAKVADWTYGISTSLGLTDRRDRKVVTLTIARSVLRNYKISHRHSPHFTMYDLAERRIDSLLMGAQGAYSIDEADRPVQIQNAVNVLLVETREGETYDPMEARKRCKAAAEDWFATHGPFEGTPTK